MPLRNHFTNFNIGGGILMNPTPKKLYKNYITIHSNIYSHICHLREEWPDITPSYL